MYATGVGVGGSSMGGGRAEGAGTMGDIACPPVPFIWTDPVVEAAGGDTTTGTAAQYGKSLFQVLNIAIQQCLELALHVSTLCWTPT